MNIIQQNKSDKLFSLIRSKFDEEYIIELMDNNEFDSSSYHYYENHQTPFLLAAYHGMSDVVKKMLQQLENKPDLFDLSQTNNFGENALMVAIRRTHVKVAKNIIRHYKKYPQSFDINSTNQRGESILHPLLYLLHKQTLPLLKSILSIKEFNVNLVEERHCTAFLYCMNNYTTEAIKVQILEYLIEYNKKHQRFNFNIPDEVGYNGFLATCAQDDVEQLLSIFFKHADIFHLHSTLHNGKNALAVSENNPSVFTQILNYAGFQNTEFLIQALEVMDSDKKELKEVLAQHIIVVEKQALENSILSQNKPTIKINKI